TPGTTLNRPLRNGQKITTAQTSGHNKSSQRRCSIQRGSTKGQTNPANSFESVASASATSDQVFWLPASPISASTRKNTAMESLWPLAANSITVSGDHQ